MQIDKVDFKNKGCTTYDRVDGRDDGGGDRYDGGRRYFPTYFSSFHFLFISFLDFSLFFFFFF